MTRYDQADVCRCRHILHQHHDADGECTECGCPEFRYNAHGSEARP